MRRVVFTNGVFDVLHIGHLKLLEFCKRQGDYLVVAIDSDNRVKQTKGQNRPVYGEQERKSILEAIRHVDEVIVFDSMDDLRNLHRTIQPDVVVKGSDWSEERLRQTDGICENSKVVLYERIQEYSTTNTIEKIKCL
jgi:D-beta-D-heptose 7-phosphate kinase/D-beta-D-heptose 1-phosphate adenosyltransferase